MNISSQLKQEQVASRRLQIIRECARTGGVYVRYYRLAGDDFQELPVYTNSTDQGISQLLEEYWPVSSQKFLLENYLDNQFEDVVVSNLTSPFLEVGMCLRDEERQVEGVIVLMAINREAIESEGFQAKGMLLSDEESISNVIRLITDVVSYQQEAHKKSEEIEGTLRSVREESTRDRELLERNSVMTEILAELESDEEFLHVTEQVLTLAASHLKLSEAALIRRDSNKMSASMIAEFCQPADLQMMSHLKERDLSRLPFYTGRPYTISSGTELPQNFRTYFNEFSIRAGAFYPLIAEEEASMYLQFTSHTDRRWDAEDLKFLNDVKKVLQSVLTKRITRNSLTGSYVTLDSILENAGCGIQVADLVHRQILYTNQNLKDALKDPEDLEELNHILFLAQRAEGVHHEFEAKRAERWFDLTFTKIKWVDGREVRLMTAYDITKLKAYQRRIERQANTDYLTGLKNRKRCEEDLSKELQKAVKSQKQGAFFYLDMDDFRDINDSFGHAMGDELLKQISEKLIKIGGIQADIYRFGGDEFAIMIPSENELHIEKIQSRLQEEFGKPWNIGGHEFYCTMSMGMVNFPRDGQDVTTLIKRADMALRSAKQSGKNRIESFNETLPGTSTRRLDLEHAMRNAVEAGCKEFEVYYQPLVDVSKENHPCCGAEALVRWRSEELGFVMPNEFVPMAEYLGLIVPIGKHVLLQACRRCKYWNDFGHPEYKINVNLSVVQLLQEDIIETVEGALRETGLRPENLTLEVTEGLAIHDVDSMIRLLTNLRKLGVRVALDDFGTGYSSLSYLRNMPLDVIKIDKCFIDDVGDDQFADAFVKTVTRLADVIDVNVVVEGVEREKQAEALSTMHIDMIQGYLYDMPLTQEEFEKKYVEES